MKTLQTPLGGGRRYLPNPRLATPRNITAASTTATTSSNKKGSSFAIVKQSGAVRLSASVPRVLVSRELNLRSDSSSSSPIGEEMDAKRDPGKGKELEVVGRGSGQRQSPVKEKSQSQHSKLPEAVPAPPPGPPRAVLGSGTSWKGLERFMFSGKVQREVRPFG
jgi:hypothetical protein